MTEEASELVLKRFSSLPFQYYREIYSPVTEEPKEPVLEDLCDDLIEICIDKQISHSG